MLSHSAPTVGIDVSKNSFDAHVFPSGLHSSHVFDSKSVQAFISMLLELQPQLVVLEATGGYERSLVAALHDANLPVAIVNPRQARDFAKGVGQLAKTDKVDAAILARFGALVELRRSLPESHAHILLAEIATRRRQLIAMRASELNRLQQVLSKPIRNCINRMIRTLSKQIDAHDSEIAELIQANSVWKQTAEIVQSTPGVGPTTSALLVSEMPELGRLNRQQIAALAGLAPYARDSGKSSGARSIWGGRSAVRCGLYMATLTAKKHNPLIRAFALRLEAAGKPFKVVMTACMRKLLTVLNCMVKNKTTWSYSCLKNS